MKVHDGLSIQAVCRGVRMMRGYVGFTFMSHAERDGSALFEGSGEPLISETHTQHTERIRDVI